MMEYSEKLLKRIRADYQRRRRMDADEGKWVTTGTGRRIHFNEQGEIDKGNPHVVGAAKSGGAEVSSDFKAPIPKSNKPPQKNLSSLDKGKFLKRLNGQAAGGNAWLENATSNPAKVSPGQLNRMAEMNKEPHDKYTVATKEAAGGKSGERFVIPGKPTIPHKPEVPGKAPNSPKWNDVLGKNKEYFDLSKLSAENRKKVEEKLEEYFGNAGNNQEKVVKENLLSETKTPEQIEQERKKQYGKNWRDKESSAERFERAKAHGFEIDPDVERDYISGKGRTYGGNDPYKDVDKSVDEYLKKIDGDKYSERDRRSAYQRLNDPSPAFMQKEYIMSDGVMDKLSEADKASVTGIADRLNKRLKK